MDLKCIAAANRIPDDFNAIIEIPAYGHPIKLELNKDCGLLEVDRFMPTAMHYPCNYGFVPNTLAEDGDPVDVLVITPLPLPSGVLVRCRALGLLEMADEKGEDSKILAVPIDKVCPVYRHHYRQLDDVAPTLRQAIEHFFAHYKDLEDGKWVKIKGWKGIDAAAEELRSSIRRQEAALVS